MHGVNMYKQWIIICAVLVLISINVSSEVPIECTDFGYRVPSTNQIILGESTYIRSDGVCRPLKEAEIGTSNWPYTMEEVGGDIVLSRKGKSISLPNPDWLNYNFGFNKIGFDFTVNNIYTLQERSTVYNDSCRYIPLGEADGWVKLAKYTYGDFSWDEHFTITDSGVEYFDEEIQETSLNISSFDNDKAQFKVVNKNLYFLECDTPWFVNAEYPIQFSFNPQHPLTPHYVFCLFTVTLAFLFLVSFFPFVFAHFNLA